MHFRIEHYCSSLISDVTEKLESRKLKIFDNAPIEKGLISIIESIIVVAENLSPYLRNADLL